MKWLESKYDCKFGFSMLLDPTVQCLKQLGHPPVAFNSSLLFLLVGMCMQVIVRGSSVMTYTTGIISSSTSRYQDGEINYRILTKTDER